MINYGVKDTPTAKSSTSLQLMKYFNEEYKEYIRRIKCELISYGNIFILVYKDFFSVDQYEIILLCIQFHNCLRCVKNI